MSLLRDKILKNICNQDIENLLEPRIIKAVESTNILIKKHYQISVVTTCMNRLSDIKQTFLKNVEDNADYPEAQFVLLNYNSKDGLDDWAKKNLTGLIKEGRVDYYKTSIPEYYSMTHSRNIAFRMADGELIHSVDADHFTCHGFCSRMNALANHYQHKTIFVKSKQKNRGRLGFFKKEFIKLGGYDESIIGYGFDDKDLLFRAAASGFTVVKYGGDFCRITTDHRRHPVDSYAEEDKDWKYTQRRNALQSILSIFSKKLVANKGRAWGQTKLIKNFNNEEVIRDN